MNEEKLKALYEGLKANKYIQGMPDDYTVFSSALQDSTKRAAFFNGIKQNKYIQGLPESMEAFDSALGFGQPVNPAEPDQGLVTQQQDSYWKGLSEQYNLPVEEVKYKVGQVAPDFKPTEGNLLKGEGAFLEGVGSYLQNRKVGAKQLVSSDEEMIPLLESIYSDATTESGDDPTLLEQAGTMIGQQTIPIIQAGLAGLVGNVPGAVAASTSDAALQGFAGAIQQNYIKARAQGMSPTTSYAKALMAGQAGAIGGAAEGALGAVPFFGKFLGKLPKKQMFKVLADLAGDAGADAMFAGLSQAGQNYYADNSLGIQTDIAEGLVENMSAEAIFSFAMNAITKGGGVNPKAKQDLAAIINKTRPESEAAALIARIDSQLKAKGVQENITEDAKVIAPEGDLGVIEDQVDQAIETEVNAAVETTVEDAVVENVEEKVVEVEKAKDEIAKLEDKNRNLKASDKVTKQEEVRNTEKIKEAKQVVEEAPEVAAAEIPVEEQVKQLAKKIVDGKRSNTKEELDLYQNNKTEVENEIQRLTPKNDKTQPETTEDKTISKKSQPEVKGVKETKQEAKPNPKVQEGGSGKASVKEARAPKTTSRTPAQASTKAEGNKIVRTPKVSDTPKPKSNRGGARKAKGSITDQKATTMYNNIVAARKKGDKSSALKRAEAFITKHGKDHPKTAQKFKDFIDAENKPVDTSKKKLTEVRMTKEVSPEVAEAQKAKKEATIERRNLQDTYYNKLAKALGSNDTDSFGKILEEFNSKKKNPITEAQAKEKIKSAEKYSKSFETAKNEADKQKSKEVKKTKKEIAKADQGKSKKLKKLGSDEVKKVAEKVAPKKKVQDLTDKDVDSIIEEASREYGDDAGFETYFSGDSEVTTVTALDMVALKGKPVKLKNTTVVGRLLTAINSNRDKVGARRVTIRVTDNMSSVLGENVKGFYNADFDVIYLDRAYATSKKGNDLVIHELLHPITNLLYEGVKGMPKTNAKIRAIQQDLNLSHKYAVDYIKDVLAGKVINIKLSLLLDGRTDSDIYGLTNVDEMVSEAFSSQDFASILAAIPNRKVSKTSTDFRSTLTSLVDNITKFIAEKLGVNIKDTELNNVLEAVKDFEEILTNNSDLSVSNLGKELRSSASTVFKKVKDKQGKAFVNSLANELYTETGVEMQAIKEWVKALNVELADQGRPLLTNNDLVSIKKRLAVLKGKKTAIGQRATRLADSQLGKEKTFERTVTALKETNIDLLSTKESRQISKAIDFFLDGEHNIKGNEDKTKKNNNTILRIAEKQASAKFISETKNAGFNTRTLLGEWVAGVLKTDKKEATARSAAQISKHLAGFDTENAERLNNYVYSNLRKKITNITNNAAKKSKEITTILTDNKVREEDLYSTQIRNMLIRADNIDVTDPNYPAAVKANFKALEMSLREQIRKSSRGKAKKGNAFAVFESEASKKSRQLEVLMAYKDEVDAFDGTQTIKTKILGSKDAKKRTEGVDKFNEWLQTQIKEYGKDLELSSKLYWGKEFNWVKSNYTSRAVLGKVGESEGYTNQESFLSLLEDSNPTDNRLNSTQASASKKAGTLDPNSVYDLNALAVAMRFIEESEFDINVTPEVKRLNYAINNKAMAAHLGDIPSGGVVSLALNREAKNIDVVKRSLRSAIRQASNSSNNFGAVGKAFNKVTNTTSLAIMSNAWQFVNQYVSMWPSIAVESPKNFVKAFNTQLKFLVDKDFRDGFHKMLSENNVGLSVRDALFERGLDIKDIGVGSLAGGYKRALSRAQETNAKLITAPDKKSATLSWLTAYYKNGGTDNFSNFNETASRKAESSTELLQNINVAEFSASIFRPTTTNEAIFIKGLMAFKSFQFQMTMNALQASSQLVNMARGADKGGSAKEATKMLTKVALSSLGYAVATEYRDEWREEVADVLAKFFLGTPDPVEQEKVDRDVIDYMAITANDAIFSGLPLGDVVGPKMINTLLALTRDKYKDSRLKDLPIKSFPKRDFDQLGPASMILNEGKAFIDRQIKASELNRDLTTAEKFYVYQPLLSLLTITAPVRGNGIIFATMNKVEQRNKDYINKLMETEGGSSKGFEKKSTFKPKKFNSSFKSNKLRLQKSNLK